MCNLVAFSFKVHPLMTTKPLVSTISCHFWNVPPIVLVLQLLFLDQLLI